MIHNNDWIGRLAALWDLHNACDRQSIAWILDPLADKIISLKQSFKDNDLATLKLMLAQSHNCVWINRFFGRARGCGNWCGSWS